MMSISRDKDISGVSVSLADAFANFFIQEQREQWLTPKRSATSLTG